MYSYSTSLGYPTIYRFLYHIHELLDVQLQHIAWLPNHIQISLPHTGAIGCTVTAHRLTTRPYTDFSTTYMSYWMYSYSTSLGYPTMYIFIYHMQDLFDVQLQPIAWLPNHYRFLYHIRELLDVQLQHIAWLPDHIQISLPHTGAIGCTVTAHRLATRPLQISLPHTGAIGCTVTAHRLATRPYTNFSITYMSYWMYSYSTSLGYPAIYRFLYHMQELLDVQLQHIAWLPTITDFSTTYRSYWMYSYSTSLGYQTIYRFLYHIQELLDVQIQHIAWLPDHIQISLPHTGAIGSTVTAHRLATRPCIYFSTTYRSYWMYSYSTSLGYPISLSHTGAIRCTVTAHRLATRPYTGFSTTYMSYWMYSYSTSLGYPTIYRFLYHIHELLDVQLQHIAWLPDHIQISLPHT